MENMVADMEKLQLSRGDGGKVKWYNHCKQQFLKRLKIELSNEPTIAFLSTYPNKLKSGG
jgi:hypothetical protein